MFVYRDTADRPGEAAASDPSYWYDLSGTGQAEETPHVAEAARGPFEPLVSSADPPGTVRHRVPDAEETPAAEVTDGTAGADGQEDVTHAHARKLEQIKDLYLTAEAIGEANVDKHFDQLLSQQRELISEYFRQSSTPPSPGAEDQAAADTPAGPPAPASQVPEPQAPEPRAPEPPATGSWFVPESARVAADQPRAW